MYLTINSGSYANANSTTAQGERNDCVVRAMATATGVDYDTAHSFVKTTMNRQSRMGVETSVIKQAFNAAEKSGIVIGDKKFDVRECTQKEIKNRYKLHGEVVWRKKTLKSFLQANKRGTFLVIVSGHAITVKDGEVFDWQNNAFLPTRKVLKAFELSIHEPASPQLVLEF